MRRLLLVLLLMLLLSGTALYHWRSDLSLAYYNKIMANYYSSNLLEKLPDGLHAGLCGSGSPIADFKRGSPCTIVIAGKRFFIFDTGSTASNNITLMGFDLGSVEAVFLTHFHSDHIGGLGDLMLNRWLSGSTTSPLPVHGPVGVKSVVDGFMQAYFLDNFYRIAHHGEKIFPKSGAGGIPLTFSTPKIGSNVTIINEPDLTIETFRVNHSPIEPAVGYKIRYKDRTLVISGDTKKSLEVQRVAKGVDLLIHEALSFNLMDARSQLAAIGERGNLAKIIMDIQQYHTSPEQAAQTAEAAGVSYLLLTHIVPPIPLPGLKQVFLGNSANIYKGPIRIGADGDFISMPSGTKDIILSNRFKNALSINLDFFNFKD